MRVKALKSTINAIRLTVDNLEEVEKLCHGRIRGTSLPKSERIVQFDTHEFPDQGEQEIRVGDWLVQFNSPAWKSPINQSWPNEIFMAFFKDANNVPF